VSLLIACTNTPTARGDSYPLICSLFCLRPAFHRKEILNIERLNLGRIDKEAKEINLLGLQERESVKDHD